MYFYARQSVWHDRVIVIARTTKESACQRVIKYEVSPFILLRTQEDIKIVIKRDYTTRYLFADLISKVYREISIYIAPINWEPCRSDADVGVGDLPSRNNQTRICVASFNSASLSPALDGIAAYVHHRTAVGTGCRPL